MESAKEICARLSSDGVWADFIDPYSGRAVREFLLPCPPYSRLPVPLSHSSPPSLPPSLLPSLPPSLLPLSPSLLPSFPPPSLLPPSPPPSLSPPSLPPYFPRPLPSSLLPQFYSPHSNNILCETDERFRYLGFDVWDLGCCRSIAHPMFGVHAFVGTIFTSADIQSPSVQSILDL